jgi:hypothetical protein
MVKVGGNGSSGPAGRESHKISPSRWLCNALVKDCNPFERSVRCSTAIGLRDTFAREVQAKG